MAETRGAVLTAMKSKVELLGLLAQEATQRYEDAARLFQEACPHTQILESQASVQVPPERICPFCLLHEVAEGSGSNEHFKLLSGHGDRHQVAYGEMQELKAQAPFVKKIAE